MAKPFLKWAGGKYRLLKQILETLPSGERLVEPFAGSGALYLNASFQSALICDLNSDLIALYTAVQREGERFIEFCRSYFSPETNTRAEFFRLRERFNVSADPQERAALLLYLNRHSFNGLVRYNAKGRFNVPFGRYKEPYFPLAELRAFYQRTRDIETEFRVLDFRAAFERLGAGDVVYCDPPYVPLSRTAAFTSYAGNVFGRDEQTELARLAREAAGRGIPVLLSNHDTVLTRGLYAAARITRFEVRRSISRDGAHRVTAPELLAMFDR